MTSAKLSIPTKFVCPLTLNMMEDPLMTREGHSYEKTAILKWLANNNTSPLTRKPLEISQLVSNHALKNEILAWRSRFLYEGVAMDSETEFLTDEDINDDDVSDDDDDDGWDRSNTVMFLFRLTPEHMEKWSNSALLSGQETAEGHAQIVEDAVVTEETTSGSAVTESNNIEHSPRRTRGILSSFLGRGRKQASVSASVSPVN